jgi:hypothetical protein
VAVRVCVCLLSFLTRVVQSATPVSDESVSVGWWCGRLLLYFTLSLISLSLLVLSTSNNLAARRRRRRRRRRVLSLISSSSLLTFGRIVSFFHPSLDSPDTFQVSFSLHYIYCPRAILIGDGYVSVSQ